MLQQFLALAAACKVLTELLANAILPRVNYSDDTEALIKQAISVAVGILAAFATGLNLLDAFAFQFATPTAVGLIVTGIVIGFGSNVVNEIFGVLEGWHDAMTAPTATISTTTTSGASGTTTSTTAKVEGPATVTSSGSNSG